MHHAAACLNDLAQDFREELDIFNDAFAGGGHAPRALDGGKQLRRGAKVKTAR